jgi:hypothetical protein
MGREMSCTHKGRRSRRLRRAAVGRSEAKSQKTLPRFCGQGVKLHVIRPVARLVGGWLEVGILDHGKCIFPEAGTAQGGPLSPLLANIALHGLEIALCKAIPSKAPPGVIRFADDFDSPPRPRNAQMTRWARYRPPARAGNGATTATGAR